jgi:sugar phosphate isomerase/epimerase
MRTAAEVDRAFAYAERLGTRLFIGVPEPGLLGQVERAVKATGIRLAIHNHGPDMDLFQTPMSVLAHIKDLDTRIGLCVDIGHTQRCGIDPSEALLACGDRVFDVHIKDVSKAAKDGRTVALGRGVIDLHRLVHTLRNLRFAGVCGLEFESSREDTLPGLAETLGYLRGVLSKG